MPRMIKAVLQYKPRRSFQASAAHEAADCKLQKVFEISGSIKIGAVQATFCSCT